MKNSKKTIITMMMALFIVATSWSQKFGHINSQLLLIESPLVKEADLKITEYQNTLITKGEVMVKKFESEYDAYMKDRKEEILNQIQIQQRESALQATQQAIQKYEQEVQQKLAMKREELYKPILDKVKVAIDNLGKSGEYTMIFDTSTNGLLFAMEGEDLLAKVKVDLGW
ncbi:MAG: outer membrane protein [Saprospiraceae bacterium]|jgi:outer membrane protein